MAELCWQIWNLQGEEERRAVRDLFWALGREYDEGEIRVALGFLEALGVLRQEGGESYTLLAHPESVPRYLEIAVDVMRGGR